ncbi:MAG TPA: DUF4114 domain-containing protein [Steroidobacteraceae bacterium]|nr:DUF4114 domain-containing protein [Steroidobacteraceae bacterium]
MRHFLRACLGALVLISLPWSFAGAAAVCTFGGPNGESTLQAVFNNLLGASHAPNAGSDCVPEPNDGRWQTTGPASATIVIELAGFASQNTFGIYDVLDPLNPAKQLQLFAGAAGQGSTAFITFTPSGSGYSVVIGWPGKPNRPAVTFGSAAFGFYLSTPEDNPNTPAVDRMMYFSQTSLNSDGTDHLYAYRGNGSPFLAPPLNGQTFATNGALLAWEDLRGGGDRDYQDFVVYANGVTPVPLPAAAWLLGSTLPLLGLRRRRALTVA